MKSYPPDSTNPGRSGVSRHSHEYKHEYKHSPKALHRYKKSESSHAYHQHGPGHEHKKTRPVLHKDMHTHGQGHEHKHKKSVRSQSIHHHEHGHAHKPHNVHHKEEHKKSHAMHHQHKSEHRHKKVHPIHEHEHKPTIKHKHPVAHPKKSGPKLKSKLKSRYPHKLYKTIDDLHIRERQLKALVGWQEWCSLTKFHIPAIKAKIDTGAKTSALHAWDIRPFHRHGELYIHFTLHPIQRNIRITQVCSARVVDERVIISSSGQKERRYIITTPISLGDRTWEIELSLTNRDQMTFRMLLGRDALKGHLIVDPGRKLCLGMLSQKELRKLYPQIGHKPIGH
jgi:hypothetical protein